MTPKRVLKIEGGDEERELDLELAFLRSLTVEERFRLVRERSEEMIRALIRHGHLKHSEIVKRSFG